MAAENIFSQYLQPVRSVQDYTDDMDKREQNALTLAASRMKAKVDQQAMADDAASREAYIASGGDMNALQKLLIGKGLGKQAQAAAKAAADAQEQQGKIKHQTAQTAELDAKNLDSALSSVRSFANQVDSPQAAAMYLKGMYSHPILGPVASSLLPMDQAMASIPQDMNSPEGLRWKAAHMSVTGKDLMGLLMPKTDSTALGGNQSFGKTDQFSGMRTETGSAPITESANNVANNERIAREGSANRGNALTIANMADSRARDANTIAAEAKKVTVDQAKAGQVASFDVMLDSLDRLGKHPGLSRSVGKMSVTPTMPGSDSANFQAELETFKSQAFVPMVAQLKGMGALSDAEGKKLTAAVGALDPNMGETAFRQSIRRIMDNMTEARARVSGQAQPAAAPGKVIDFGSLK
jgi:hypothetical protein